MLKYRIYKVLRFFHLVSKRQSERHTKKYSKNYRLIACSHFFDKKWYLKQYPDVKNAKLDPIEHYLKLGWKEGRNPSSIFNGNEYLKINQDVKAAGVNPLVHYELYGKREGRDFCEAVAFDPIIPLRYRFLKKIRRKDSKRVLLVSHEFSYTGAPLSLLMIARTLKELGYEVTTVSFKECGLRNEFHKVGDVCITTDINAIYRLGYLCDLSIVNTLVPYKAYNVLRNIVPTIWFVREPVKFLHNRDSMCLTLESANDVYCMSEYSKNEFAELNPRISVFKHGIEDCYCEDKRIHGEFLNFAIIGSIESRKGQDVLLEAWGKLAPELRNKAKLWIIGKCSNQQYFDNLPLHNLKNIEVNRFENFEEMIAFYRSLDCVIVPSRDEPTSRVALEAMMMGVPVIMSNRVGAQYLLNGKNGFMFESENSDELARILSNILSHPDSLQVMSIEARKAYLENNSMPVFKKNLQRIVEESLKQWAHLHEDITTFHRGARTKNLFYNNKKYSPEVDCRQLTLSIVVPVYNALEDLKLLVNSLEASRVSPTTEVIFIDDCSPDANVQSYLRTLADKYTIVFNEKNLGFVQNANKGIEASKNDIVVILNEDTQIPKTFEENILRCFQSDKNIALASPIGSHTGWFQIPCEDYRLNELAELVNEASKRLYPPFTPEGFCFCCRKEVLQKIGKLDTIYGRGYCEEDDLVMRAITHGYRTVLIDDLFVKHKRHASFGSENRRELLEHNRHIFIERWRNLQTTVRSEMKCAETTHNITSAIIRLSNSRFRETTQD